jgi:dihydrofolate reductase
MAKLHVSIATTLDGFITDTRGGMDWIIMGNERAAYMVEIIKNADTLMMGRETYQGFVSWRDVPNNPNASEVEKTIGEQFNAMKKVVFSKSLEKADWQGTTILRDIVPEEIQKLKEASEKGIRLDGSASIVQQLTKLGLIDEYRLLVHPVVLGRGKPLFKERVDLELIGSQQFKSGVMLLTYQLAAGSN